METVCLLLKVRLICFNVLNETLFAYVSPSRLSMVYFTLEYLGAVV